ncbi:P-loop NTPase, partial [Salmonella enterica subsp. enterica serovar Weltevreden]
MARIIVVTSGKVGVGKTTSSEAIATGIAQKGKKTDVIDYDIGLSNHDMI